ncbi:MAG: hypothetical protein HOH66_07600 [Rhodospirillaceae bacterium]|nr:hypothetical protein [Rhodospirillaceae bacterium]
MGIELYRRILWNCRHTRGLIKLDGIRSQGGARAFGSKEVRVEEMIRKGLSGSDLKPLCAQPFRSNRHAHHVPSPTGKIELFQFGG